MQLPRALLSVIAVLASVSFALQADAQDKKVFSGPQVGEKLPSLKVHGVFGDEAGKEFDFVKLADGKPTVIVFMHKLTRPSFAVTRTLLNYAGKRKPGELFGGMVLLTADVTAAEKRLKAIQKYFTAAKNTRVAISPDGAEGPGAYGLNRNMTLTILVASKGKVTANFPLVQPSVQADVLKVAKEIVKLTGDKMPQLAELFKDQYARKKKRTGKKNRRKKGPPRDAVVMGHIREFIQSDATPAEVDKIAKQIEDRVKKQPKAAADVAFYAGVIVSRGYGTKRAQEIAKKWQKQYKTADTKRKKP
jgi:hypothetical protein